MVGSGSGVGRGMPRPYRLWGKSGPIVVLIGRGNLVALSGPVKKMGGLWNWGWGRKKVPRA